MEFLLNLIKRLSYIVKVIALLVGILNILGLVSAFEQVTSTTELRDDEKDLIDSLSISLKSKNGMLSPSHRSSLSIKDSFQIDNSLLIMEEGQFDIKWSSKCHNRIFLKKRCTHYTFDMYTDEIAFEFSLNSNISEAVASLSPFIKPSARSLHGLAKPEVSDFSYDRQSNIGEIVVSHNCQKRPKHKKKISLLRNEYLSLITLSFSISPNLAVRLNWQKVCGGGIHKRLDYGYFSDTLHSPGESTSFIANHLPTYDQSSQSFPVSMRNTHNKNVVLFGPRVLSTKLYLHLRPGANSQPFTDASVYVEEMINDDEIENNDLDGTGDKSNNKYKGKNVREPSVELRGPITGGILKRDTDTMFDIIYSCTGPGLWHVLFSVSIPPFEQIQMKWRKDCGGGVEPNIDIMNNLNFKRPDIVRQGMTLPHYSNKLTFEQFQRKKIVSYHGRGNRIFFLRIDGRSMNSGEGGIEIGEVVANSEDERIGIARIPDASDNHHHYHTYEQLLNGAGPGSRRIAGLKSIPDNGEVITKKVKRIVVVRMDCLKKGWIRIAVHMAIRDRKPIEWFFYNHCEVRKSYRNRNLARAMWETGFVMMLFFLSMFLVLRRVHQLPNQKQNRVLHSRYRGPIAGPQRFRTVYSDDDPRSV